MHDVGRGSFFDFIFAMKMTHRESKTLFFLSLGCFLSRRVKSLIDSCSSARLQLARTDDLQLVQSSTCGPPLPQRTHGPFAFLLVRSLTDNGQRHSKCRHLRCYMKEGNKSPLE